MAKSVDSPAQMSLAVDTAAGHELPVSSQMVLARCIEWTYVGTNDIREAEHVQIRALHIHNCIRQCYRLQRRARAQCSIDTTQCPQGSHSPYPMVTAAHLYHPLSP